MSSAKEKKTPKVSDDDELSDGAEGDGEEGGSKVGGKKTLIFIIIGVVLLLVIIGAALFFTGVIGGDKEAEAEAAEAAALAAEEELAAGPGYMYTLPDFLVNLSSDGRRSSMLKITVAIELNDELDVPAVEESLPRIRDHFQTYLRELRPEDLRGSAGVYRLRQELLSRIIPAVEPVKVRDVLFQEILVQ